MIVKKTMGFVILTPNLPVSQKGLLDIFIPRTMTSRRWRHWKATIDLKTCSDCLDHHGKVYAVDEHIPQKPPLHPFCRCVVEPMEAIEHGGATKVQPMKKKMGQIMYSLHKASFLIIT